MSPNKKMYYQFNKYTPNNFFFTTIFFVLKFTFLYILECFHAILQFPFIKQHVNVWQNSPDPISTDQ